jgi:hypothetical protein
MLPNQHGLFASAILLRTLLMVGLSVEYGLLLFATASPISSRLRRFVLVLPIVTVLIGVLVTGGLALRAYFSEQYAQDPYREVMDLIRTQDDAGVILANESLYHRFYPYLGLSASLRLVDASEDSLDQLAQLASKHDILWVVDSGTEGEQAIKPVVEQWLSVRTYPMDDHWFGNARLSSYATGEPLPQYPQGAGFGDMVRLVSSGLEPGPFRPGDTIRLALEWQALTGIDQDYAVFVHLVGHDGRIWSQRDSQPVGGFRPTSGWTVGETIEDNHALSLSLQVPAGEYRLVVGLYSVDDGQRLPLTGEGAMSRGDALELGTLVILAPEE